MEARHPQSPILPHDPIGRAKSHILIVPLRPIPSRIRLDQLAHIPQPPQSYPSLIISPSFLRHALLAKFLNQLNRTHLELSSKRIHPQVSPQAQSILASRKSPTTNARVKILHNHHGSSSKARHLQIQTMQTIVQIRPSKYPHHPPLHLVRVRPHTLHICQIRIRHIQLKPRPSRASHPRLQACRQSPHRPHSRPIQHLLRPIAPILRILLLKKAPKRQNQTTNPPPTRLPILPLRPHLLKSPLNLPQINLTLHTIHSFLKILMYFINST